MSFFATLESRLGRFAIPGLIRVIALFQLLNWFLISLVPDFRNLLVFDLDAILAGQVWRLASYVLLPGSLSLVWLIFGVMFMWMLSDGLEAEWGAFRVNLYLLAGIFFAAIGGIISPMPASGWILWASVLFAFAYYYPDFEIYLYGIVPLQMKWVAGISAGTMAFNFLGMPSMRVPIFFGLLNFLLVFTPGFLKSAGDRAKVGARRQRMKDAMRDESEPLNTCVKCGKTDIDHPQLGFRVNAEGDDVCDECRLASASTGRPQSD